MKCEIKTFSIIFITENQCKQFRIKYFRKTYLPQMKQGFWINLVIFRMILLQYYMLKYISQYYKYRTNRRKILRVIRHLPYSLIRMKMLKEKNIVQLTAMTFNYWSWRIKVCWNNENEMTTVKSENRKNLFI